jgi:hypothetical protein
MKVNTEEMKNNVLLIIWLLCLCMAVFLNKRDKVKPEISYSNSENGNWDQFCLVRKLSVEKLQSYNGFENITDEKANEVIEALYQLSIISYNATKNQGSISVGKESII